jgi:predicted transcriptional regulator
MDDLSTLKRNVLISVRPLYAKEIVEGRKTVELRRKFPGTEAAGGTVVIYSSSPVRAVVAVARIKSILYLPVPTIWRQHGSAASISKQAFDDYFCGCDKGFAVLLDKVTPLPRQLDATELKVAYGIVPPQSYRYLGGDCTGLLGDERVQAPHRYKRRDRARRLEAC